MNVRINIFKQNNKEYLSITNIKTGKTKYQENNLNLKENQTYKAKLFNNDFYHIKKIDSVFSNIKINDLLEEMEDL